MAQPQNTIPTPISTLVMIAGVEWNCVNVYSMMPVGELKDMISFLLLDYTLIQIYLPVKNIGIDMKKPATAHTRLTLDFCRYLLPLEHKIE